jgi:hypothetical protein
MTSSLNINETRPMDMEVPRNASILNYSSIKCTSSSVSRYHHADLCTRSFAYCTWGAEGASMAMNVNERVISESCSAYAIGPSSIIE